MGRFINADGLVSTGQGLLGYNMFAYCENNPANRKDGTGLLSVEIGRIIAKTIIGGVVSAACKFAIGGTLEEVAVAFAEGLISGFVSSLGSYFQFGVIIYDVVATVVQCYNSGASIKNSLIAGGVELICSLPYFAELDILSDCIYDLTIGMGFSYASAKITELIKSDVEYSQNTIISFVKPDTSTPNPTITPSNSNYKPSYTGMGRSSVGCTRGNGFRIPTVNNFGRIA